MSNLRNGILAVSLREAWIRLPDAEDDADARIAEIVQAIVPATEEAAAQRLARALAVVNSVAAGLPAGARENNALVLSPLAGRVEALLSMRVSRVGDDAYDRYLALARAFAGDESAEVINRVVEEVTLPAGRGIVSSDFTLPASDAGVPDPAMERAFLAYFPDGYGTVAEFTLLTQNLALFSDARAYLLALAAGDNPPLPGMEE